MSYYNLFVFVFLIFCLWLQTLENPAFFFTPIQIDLMLLLSTLHALFTFSLSV